jgi:phosphonoacetaldehyde hydrolase
VRKGIMVHKKIEGVIFDWAGTTVDYGCFAPLTPFIRVFEEFGLSITLAEARGPMGMLKWDHIHTILQMPRVSAAFETLKGRPWVKTDVDALYEPFMKYLFADLVGFTDPIEGVLGTIAMLRQENIKIGSTTGYTKDMMAIVAPEASKKGYTPDYYICSDEVPKGRPYPFMIYANMLQLGLGNTDCIIKVGDTLSDIGEGRQAKVWSVGVVCGSSEMALSEKDFLGMSMAERKQAKDIVKNRMYAAGAHYVIDTMSELSNLIQIINTRLAQGDTP